MRHCVQDISFCRTNDCGSATRCRFNLASSLPRLGSEPCRWCPLYALNLHELACGIRECHGDPLGLISESIDK
eukprot:595121-Amphidinium_carterae.1